MFISYAQNLEDLLLWRAFGPLQKGFYIDVGAWHPETDSVTKCFYDIGWSGINIEPDDHMFEQLMTARDRDVNLKLALSDAPGLQTFFTIGETTGLNTVCRDVMEMHRAAGYSIMEKDVSSSTLSSICDKYAPPEIHFLKIDVEGAEYSVLQGADFNRFRPWIVLVEATVPLSLTPSFGDWEPLLLNSNYEYVYTDGINRFYISSEKHSELKQAFSFPPNVFDNYVRANERRFWQNFNGNK
jgi:FkbM family methyltransferase